MNNTYREALTAQTRKNVQSTSQEARGTQPLKPPEHICAPRAHSLIHSRDGLSKGASHRLSRIANTSQIFEIANIVENSQNGGSSAVLALYFDCSGQTQKLHPADLLEAEHDTRSRPDTVEASAFRKITPLRTAVH